MKSTESAEQEIQKITFALGAALRAAQLRQSALETRLGWSAGYLSRLLSGSIDLKVVHLAILLREVGLPLERFFAIAAQEDDRDLAERLRQAVTEHRSGTVAAEARLPAGDLEHQVKAVLSQALTRMLAALDEPAAAR